METFGYLIVLLVKLVTLCTLITSVLGSSLSTPAEKVGDGLTNPNNKPTDNPSDNIIYAHDIAPASFTPSASSVTSSIRHNVINSKTEVKFDTKDHPKIPHEPTHLKPSQKVEHQEFVPNQDWVLRRRYFHQINSQYDIQKRSVSSDDKRSPPQYDFELSAVNAAKADLDYIDQVLLWRHCDVNVKKLNTTYNESFYAEYIPQTQRIKQIAQVLNILSPYCNNYSDIASNTRIFGALLKSAILPDDSFYSVAIWLQSSCVRVTRRRNGTLGPLDNNCSPQELYESYHQTIAAATQRHPKASCIGKKGNKLCALNVTSLMQDNGTWSGPEFVCDRETMRGWVIAYSVPMYSCNDLGDLQLRGVVRAEIDLEKVGMDQCDTDATKPYHRTHSCTSSTQCEYRLQPDHKAFQSGNYICKCKEKHYFPTMSSYLNDKQEYFNGSEVENAFTHSILNQSTTYADEFSCLPCAPDCDTCQNDSVCFAKSDVIMKRVSLGITSFCMTIVLILAYSIIRLRKSRVMKASFWLLLEICLFGALLLYSTIILQYFEPSTLRCLLIPWFREVGFSILYGALVLKVYRVLAEFQSRKAHRVHVRDKDLLKWLFIIVCVVIGYMSAWTALNIDHIHEGTNATMLDVGQTSGSYPLKYRICKERLWDYLIELGEFLFLCFGIYLCYCIRSAPSDYFETRYISWAIYNETIISAILHIARHILWNRTNPDYIYLGYFLRCQLTVSVNLALVLGPKIFYAHHPPDDDSFRRRAYSSSDVAENALPESVKLHVGVNSNGDVDVGEVNLSEMDPEDIRAELRRLYTQLQIYKTKTMRKDNPHISKRRGGRKHTHRRFSLQAFHHKHRHHHSHHHHQPSMSEVSQDHDTEMSRTPEESTNSAEAYGYSIEESTASVADRTPTVTFKPGHKTIY